MRDMELVLPHDVILTLAHRLKTHRKKQGFSQKELASKCGVTYGSLKRFEQTGEISLISLAKIAFALGKLSELECLFKQKTYKSIEEVIEYNETNR